MKKILFLLSTAAALTLAACSHHCDGKCDAAKCTDPNCPHKKEAAATVADSTKSIAAAAYDCPMHCKGAASDKPGTCPVCKMDLVKTK
jgi:protein involved in sex pheromone biosynthesis